MKDSIGAIWIKTSKKGDKYMSGIIDVDGQKINIVVFKNDRKESDKHPDYKIYISEKREEKKDADNGEIPF